MLPLVLFLKSKKVHENQRLSYQKYLGGGARRNGEASLQINFRSFTMVDSMLRRNSSSILPTPPDSTEAKVRSGQRSHSYKVFNFPLPPPNLSNISPGQSYLSIGVVEFKRYIFIEIFTRNFLMTFLPQKPHFNCYHLSLFYQKIRLFH